MSSCESGRTGVTCAGVGRCCGVAVCRAPVVVLPVSAAKGLEFDAVLLVEPAELLAESPRGRNDLYVALTRATQRLAVVHAAPLPPVLHGLPE